MSCTPVTDLLINSANLTELFSRIIFFIINWFLKFNLLKSMILWITSPHGQILIHFSLFQLYAQRGLAVLMVGGSFTLTFILNLSHCKYWRTLKCSKCLQKHNTIALFDSVVNLANKHWSLFSLWAVLVVATFKWPVANIQQD